MMPEIITAFLGVLALIAVGAWLSAIEDSRAFERVQIETCGGCE